MMNYQTLKQKSLSIAKQWAYGLTEFTGDQLLRLKPLPQLNRQDLLHTIDAERVWRFGPSEQFHYPAPVHVEVEIPQPLQPFMTPLRVEPPFVCELPNAELLGPEPIALHDQAIVLEASTTDEQFHSSLPTALNCLLRHKLPIDLQLDVAWCLAHGYSRNYFHWITEFLSRLEALDYYQQQTGRRPLLILGAKPRRWQLESLQLMGYPPEDCIIWDLNRVMVNRLVVPSLRRFQSDWPHDRISPAACQWLRQRMLSSLPKGDRPTAKRILISRRKAASRRILNEDAVMAALRPLGFVDCLPEELSFSEQIRLFADAEVIIAPHGSGLTNVLFAQEAIVVELFGPPAYVRPDYFQLASAIGLKYGFVLCEAQGDDIQVQIDKLLPLLAKLGIDRG
jgi:hypothetical protein